MGLLVDGEVELLLEREEGALLGVLVEGELGLLDEAAQVGILHEAEQLAVARLAELDLEHLAAGHLEVALIVGFLCGRRQLVADDRLFL